MAVCASTSCNLRGCNYCQVETQKKYTKRKKREGILPQPKETPGRLAENMDFLDFRDHEKQRGKAALPSPEFQINLFLLLF